MAIVVEEKRNNQGKIIGFLIWLVVLGALSASAYYIFFKKPELVEFRGSPSFNNVQQLSKISIDPGSVVNSPQFLLLKQYVNVSVPQDVGRPNPFLGF